MHTLWVRKLAWLASLLLLVASTDCKRNGCDRNGLTKLGQALDGLAGMDSGLRLRIGIQGLHEACGKNLPDEMDKAMAAFAQASPADGATIIAMGLSKSMSFGRDACPDFERVFGSVAAAEPTSKAKALYEGCQYGKLGLVTAAEFDTIGMQNFAGALATPPLYVWLKDHGVEQAEARTLMRKILSLP